MKFTTTVELAGKTATGFCVPDDVVEALGPSKRPAVTVTVGAHTYRSTVARMGGRFMVPLAAEHRVPAGVAAGDEVEVDIVADNAPREVDVPDDVAAALTTSGLRTVFDSLAFTHRKEWVRSINEAKSPETRRGRIDKAIAAIG